MPTASPPESEDASDRATARPEQAGFHKAGCGGTGQALIGVGISVRRSLPPGRNRMTLRSDATRSRWQSRTRRTSASALKPPQLGWALLTPHVSKARRLLASCRPPTTRSASRNWRRRRWRVPTRLARRTAPFHRLTAAVGTDAKRTDVVHLDLGAKRGPTEPIDVPSPVRADELTCLRV